MRFGGDLFEKLPVVPDHLLQNLGDALGGHHIARSFNLFRIFNFSVGDKSEQRLQEFRGFLVAEQMEIGLTPLTEKSLCAPNYTILSGS